MTQLSLLNQPELRAKKRGHVPRTSVLAYQDAQPHTRAAEVLAAVIRFTAVIGYPLTSAELAETAERDLLFIRRGLSDLLADGAVEHAAPRKCRVSQRLCLTWRITGL